MELESIDESLVNIQKKKGRPKKIVENPEEIVEKKKRGRKKKNIDEEEEPKVKRKRGRKAVPKFFKSDIRKKIQCTSFDVQDNGKFILHLDIKDKAISQRELTYDALKICIDSDNLEIENKVDDDDIIYEYMDSQNTDNPLSLDKLYKDKIQSRLTQDQKVLTKLNNLNFDDNMFIKLTNNTTKTFMNLNG